MGVLRDGGPGARVFLLQPRTAAHHPFGVSSNLRRLGVGLERTRDRRARHIRHAVRSRDLPRTGSPAGHRRSELPVRHSGGKPHLRRVHSHRHVFRHDLCADGNRRRHQASQPVQHSAGGASAAFRSGGRADGVHFQEPGRGRSGLHRQARAFQQLDRPRGQGFSPRLDDVLLGMVDILDPVCGDVRRPHFQGTHGPGVSGLRSHHPDSLLSAVDERFRRHRHLPVRGRRVHGRNGDNHGLEARACALQDA